MFHTLRSPRVAASLLLLAVTAGASGTALGQDQPAVFVHGLTQTGNAWGFIAPQLQNQFQLRALHPTLGWQAPYELQASALHDSLAGLSGVAAIGHSNGGIVVRTYLNQYGSASRINRVLTVGSLHQGAPLAGHALNGAVEQWGANVFGSMSSAIGFYADNDPDWPNVLGQFGSDLAGALGVISWAFQNIGDVVAAIGFFVPSVALPPVLPEMVPGSGTFQTINASGNLQLESSITAYRVSIATTADEGRMPWALWTNNP